MVMSRAEAGTSGWSQGGRRESGELPTRADAQLGVDVGEVVSTVRSQMWSRSPDRPGGEALDRQGHHLVLPVGERLSA